MRSRFVLLVLLGASLCGCAHHGAPKSTVGSMSGRPLVSPAALGARAATQVVHGAFGDREMTFNCVLSVQNGSASVVGLTALGMRAFTLRYDGERVQVENDLPVPAQLTPERLLADIQLVFWPSASLQAPLKKAGFRLTEPFAHTRRLFRGDMLIAEVHYEGDDPWTGRSWLVNLEYRYTLGIDSSALAAK